MNVIATIANILTIKMINILTIHVRCFKILKIETFKSFVIDHSRITIIIIKIQLIFINLLNFTTINKNIKI